MGARVVNVARGGHSIDELIAVYDYPDIRGAEAVLFVHGEKDGRIETAPGYYIDRVEYYRKMLSDQAGADLPLLISSVGYYANQPRPPMDRLRAAVATTGLPKWHIFFDDAQHFIDWGMLVDHVHFSADGCQLLMDAAIDFVRK